MRMTDGESSWLENPTQFPDFTIDGASLRELFDGPDDLTLFAVDEFDAPTRAESVKRLLGRLNAPPDLTPRFHRTRLDRWLHLRGEPYAYWAAAFEDRRVGLLFCRCGDLDCGRGCCTIR